MLRLIAYSNHSIHVWIIDGIYFQNEKITCSLSKQRIIWITVKRFHDQLERQAHTIKSLLLRAAISRGEAKSIPGLINEWVMVMWKVNEKTERVNLWRQMGREKEGECKGGYNTYEIRNNEYRYSAKKILKGNKSVSNFMGSYCFISYAIVNSSLLNITSSNL